MENNKYFKEPSRILRKQDIECVPVEDGRLVIMLCRSFCDAFVGFTTMEKTLNKMRTDKAAF